MSENTDRRGQSGELHELVGLREQCQQLHEELARTRSELERARNEKGQLAASALSKLEILERALADAEDELGERPIFVAGTPAAAASETEELRYKIEGLEYAARQVAGELRKIVSSKRWAILMSLVNLRNRLLRRPLERAEKPFDLAVFQQRFRRLHRPPAPRPQQSAMSGERESASTTVRVEAGPIPLERSWRGTRSRQEVERDNQALCRPHFCSSEARKVSIVIANPARYSSLTTCVAAVLDNTLYPHYEIVVVNPPAEDGQRHVPDDITRSPAVRIVTREGARTLSRARNVGADAAQGELLLFLDAASEPLSGWLSSMVGCYTDQPGTKAVGCRLLTAVSAGRRPAGAEGPRYTLGNAGVVFESQDGLLQPVGYGTAEDPLAGRFSRDRSCAAVSGHCLLVERKAFEAASGFDEAYEGGHADVDLCLRLREAGHDVVYRGDAFVICPGRDADAGSEADGREPARQRDTARFGALWTRKLRRAILLDRLSGAHTFSQSPLHVVIAVTEATASTSAGDYYTAAELARELKRLSYRVSYVSRRPDEAQWYELPPDADVLVGLLDAYDLRRVRCANSELITVAWIRNWTHRWLSRAWIDSYDLLLASSQVSADLVAERLHRKCGVLRLAANPHRFYGSDADPLLTCDACFTGSYWNDHREVIDNLGALAGRRVRVHGHNWERVPAMREFDQGPLPYDRLNALYNSATLVIDDANRQTKPYASLNSRVFDALAAGTLVVTNNRRGSEEVFQGRLPVYESPAELRQLVGHYTEHSEERVSLVRELADMVRAEHTYWHRARQLRDYLAEHVRRLRYCIKIGAPRWEEIDRWGDFHMASALERQFERSGCPTLIQILPEWSDGEDARCDVVLVLRGLSVYEPKAHHINLMWNISHPDKVPLQEYEEYDTAFVASESYAGELRGKLSLPVVSLLQCTDPQLFYPRIEESVQSQLLYVGNSRRVYRRALKDLLPTRHGLAVYGAMWEDLIDASYVKATHFPNQHLNCLYSSCDILLNDHWDDMREKGFVSNRLFDAAACETFVITDQVTGLDQAFEGSIVGYEDAEDLRSKLDHFLAHPEERKQLGRRAAQIVREHHTFANRAAVIMQTAERLSADKRPAELTQSDQARVTTSLQAGSRSAYRAIREVECTVCGWKGAGFDALVTADARYADAACPSCRSLARQRGLVYCLTRLLTVQGMRILDISPGPDIGRPLEKLEARYSHLELRSWADLGSSLEQRSLDDGAFDVILCCDVLQRVPDDVSVLRVLRSIMPVGGILFAAVPVRRELEQTRELGKPDRAGRFRYYGPDVEERLRSAGFGYVADAELGEVAPRDYALHFGFLDDSCTTFVCANEPSLVFSLVAGRLSAAEAWGPQQG